MNIQTANGVQRIGGNLWNGHDLENPPVGITAQKITKNYIDHSNDGRRDFNETILHAQSLGRMVGVRLAEMIPDPSWLTFKGKIFTKKEEIL
jgi:hypothetical protein